MAIDIDTLDQATGLATQRIRDYFNDIHRLPVRSNAKPGDVKALLPHTPPRYGEAIDRIFSDFDKVANIGLTHWNHPRFFAYFPCSTSAIALAANQLASALCQQGMLWQTSPLSTELEERCIEWIIQMLGLPKNGFDGVINDTASTSTFSATLMARERATEGQARQQGLHSFPPLRVYTSPEAHSSVTKAVWLAGLGAENLMTIPTGANDQIDISQLRTQISADRQKGLLPAMIVGVAGGTRVGAFDDLHALGQVAVDEGLFYHVDAAWAGVAAISCQFRTLFKGWELADSIVINPHKWLSTGMECSVFLVKDMSLLRKTMAIVPSYLETQGQYDFMNYSEFTPQLGRNFRSLKLWFVIKFYGIQGLAKMLEDHVAWTYELCERLEQHPQITITTRPRLSLFSFALADDVSTASLLEKINSDGRIYLTQTDYKKRKVIRFVTGTASCTREDVLIAGDVIEELLNNKTA